MARPRGLLVGAEDHLAHVLLVVGGFLALLLERGGLRLEIDEAVAHAPGALLDLHIAAEGHDAMPELRRLGRRACRARPGADDGLIRDRRLPLDAPEDLGEKA